jgi:hypothetical protein
MKLEKVFFSLLHLNPCLAKNTIVLTSTESHGMMSVYLFLFSYLSNTQWETNVKSLALMLVFDLLSEPYRSLQLRINYPWKTKQYSVVYEWYVANNVDWQSILLQTERVNLSLGEI